MSETEPPPSAIRCLVAEDETLVAIGLRFGLEREGFEVVGLATTIDEAVALANDAVVDVALLDVSLHGVEVFPAAEVLLRRRIPFVFHTGHGDRLDLDTRYPTAPVCVKPTESATIAQTLRSLLPGRT